MCLSKVTNKHKKNEGIGYKLVYLLTDGVRTKYAYEYYKFNRWYRAKVSSSGCVVKSDKYKKGFHIYKNKKDVLDELHFLRPYGYILIDIVKVQYKDVIASGTDEGYSVIVADKIKYIKE